MLYFIVFESFHKKHILMFCSPGVIFSALYIPSTELYIIYFIFLNADSNVGVVKTSSELLFL